MLLHVLIAMVAGWIQRHQQHLIAYLQEDNRVSKPASTAVGCA